MKKSILFVLAALIGLFVIGIVAVISFSGFGADRQSYSEMVQGTSSQPDPLEEYKATRQVTQAPGNLRDLIAAAKVADFNTLRQSPALAGKTLDMSGLVLTGLDLRGIDLSETILSHADFSGCDLRKADFRKSFLVGARMYEPSDLERGVTAQSARPTRIEGADFTGAVLFRKNVRHVINPLEYTEAGAAIGVPVELQTNSRYGGLVRAALAQTPHAGMAFFAGPGGSTDAAAVGTPCANPFANLTLPQRAQLTALNIDVPRLAGKTGLEIRGNFTGASGSDIVNRDPDTVLVVTSPFTTHRDIYSLGPVVTIHESHFMGSIFANDVVWIRDRSMPRRLVFGKPVIAERNASLSQGKSLFSEVTLIDPPPTSVPNGWVKDLLRRLPIQNVKDRMGSAYMGNTLVPTESVDLATLLGPQAYQRLITEIPQAAGLKAVIARGEHHGDKSVDVLHDQRDVVLVIDRDFSSHGGVYSAGPVVCLGENWVQDLLSQQWIASLERARSDRRVALKQDIKIQP